MDNIESTPIFKKTEGKLYTPFKTWRPKAIPYLVERPRIVNIGEIFDLTLTYKVSFGVPTKLASEAASWKCRIRAFV